MRPEEIQDMREKSFDTSKMGSSEAFWMSEISLQLSRMNDVLEKLNLEQMNKSSKAPKQPNKVPRTRTYYAIEYVPALPVTLDHVTCDKPKDGKWDHEVLATSRQEATAKIIKKLTRERELEQDKFANAPDDLDKAS